MTDPRPYHLLRYRIPGYQDVNMSLTSVASYGTLLGVQVFQVNLILPARYSLRC
jgi:hypothetical protein